MATVIGKSSPRLKKPNRSLLPRKGTRAKTKATIAARYDHANGRGEHHHRAVKELAPERRVSEDICVVGRDQRVWHAKWVGEQLRVGLETTHHGRQ